MNGHAQYKVRIRDEYTDDDGAIVGPWLTADAGWGADEGPCPCGGIMRWAEAGYVPWHRICDRCGSHWDMRPVTIYVDRHARKPCPPRTEEYVADGGYKAAQAVYEQVRPEHISADVLADGAIYGGWARRARFYL